MTGLCQQKVEGHGAGVTSVAVLSDGRIVSGSDDKTLRIWNTLTGLCEQELKGHGAWLKSVAVLSDGRIVSRDSGDTTLIWTFDGQRFSSQSTSRNEFKRLSSDFGESLGRVALGYSVSGNWVISESFGRVFVDGPVKWVVKCGDVIAVFQDNGRDHWFREVSN